MDAAVVVTFLFVVLHTGNALVCFSCESQVSWTDCDMNQKNGTCTTGLDKCAKLYARGNGEVFARGCDTSNECTHQLTCESLELNECSLLCCDEDFCNSAAMKMSSGLFLLACVLGTLWLYRY